MGRLQPFSQTTRDPDMKPERLARRWKRRHAQLVTALKEQLRRTRGRGGAEDVHNLRVTLRRLRLSLRLARPLSDEAGQGRWRDWARRISRATSPVRDLDIAGEWLAASRAHPALLEEWQRLRQRAWLRCRRQLTPPPRGGWDRWHSAKLPKEAPRRLARRAGKLEARYCEALRAAAPRFFNLGEEDRHEFRRTVRWWRYLRELVRGRKKLKHDRRYQRLLAVQETLGELQNLALVRETLERLTPSPDRDELQALLTRQQEAQWEQARRQLRGLPLLWR